MHYLNQDSATSAPINLLRHYSFESNGKSYEQVLNAWLERFPLSWVNLALVESLYQGRYKAVSVEQILTLWQRKGKPSHHFNHDFARLVSNNLPQKFSAAPRAIASVPRSARNRLSINPKISKPVHAPQRAVVSPSSGSVRLDGPRTSSLTASAKASPVANQLASAQDVSENQANARKMEKGTVARLRNASDSQASSQDRGRHRPKLGTFSRERVKIDQGPDSMLPVAVPQQSKAGEAFNPIHQFVPQSANSDLYSKLTAIAQTSS